MDGHLRLMLCLLSAQDAGLSWLSCELISDPELKKFDAVLETTFYGKPATMRQISRGARRG